MDYFDILEQETEKLYKIASQARKKGFDVETEPEIPLAKDLAERVGGLVGPKNVDLKIKELEDQMSREEIAFEIARIIVTEKDEEGKCTMYSLSKDLITNTYPDCTKVLIPQYESSSFQTCTGSAQITPTPECNIRKYLYTDTENVPGPCESEAIEIRPNQIYADKSVLLRTFSVFR